MSNEQTLLPPNESSELQTKELALRGVIPYDIEALELNPTRCTKETLGHLEQIVQTLFWSENLTLEERRAIVLETKKLHQFLGTPWAIEKIFKILQLDANCIEWFQGNLEPYHFKVEVDVYTRGISDKLIALLELMLQSYKNVRSELDVIEVRLNSKAKLNIAMATMGGEEVTLQPWQLDQIDFNLSTKMLLASYAGEITTLYPKEN